MEMHRDRSNPGNADIRRQLGVSPQQPRSQATLCVSVEVGNLPASVYTGIGTPGADQTNRLGGDGTESTFRDLLHAARGLLSLPARVRRAVVFHADGEPHHGEITNTRKGKRGSPQARAPRETLPGQ